MSCDRIDNPDGEFVIQTRTCKAITGHIERLDMDAAFWTEMQNIDSEFFPPAEVKLAIKAINEAVMVLKGWRDSEEE